VDSDIRVVKNAVPMYMFGSKRREPIKEKIKKPKVIWTGSPTHYWDAKKLKGDMDNAWSEWLVKAVLEDKIDFFLMGAEQTPFFLKRIEGRPNYKRIGWVNSYQYAIPILDFKPDFSIMPLVPNYFNYSKSDLKAIEAYAYGAIAVGTSPFSTGKPSPYDDIFCKLPDTCTVEDIEKKIDEFTEPEMFNKTLLSQYKYLVNEGRFLESAKHINYLVSIL
jgi:hypothetical protein